MKKIDNKIEFLRSHYNFRYNEVNNKVEFKLLSDIDFKNLEDRNLNSILIQMAQHNIESSVNELRIIINSNLTPEYHPFKEYFKNLPILETTDNINKLIHTVQTHNTDFFKWSFIKWIVGWVACMINDEIINHQCVILAGKQGIGKSTWVEKLVPSALLPHYYAGNIKLGNKDTLGLLSDKCLINLDELASMNYSNVTELKELVTKSNITYRKAYGYFTETFIRRASFIGSVNGSDFLYDLTGNRRFLSFEVVSFENFGRHDIDMNLVLAEAYHLYKSGFQYWFDKDEQQIVEKNNERFMVLTYEEASLKAKYSTIPLKQYDSLTYVDILTPERRVGESDFEYNERRELRIKQLEEHESSKWLYTEEIINSITTNKASNRGDLVKFGKLLNKLGFNSKRSKKGRLYEVYDIYIDYILKDIEYEDRIYYRNQRKEEGKKKKEV